MDGLNYCYYEYLFWLLLHGFEPAFQDVNFAVDIAGSDIWSRPEMGAVWWSRGL